jgi:hypothetical protein
MLEHYVQTNQLKLHSRQLSTTPQEKWGDGATDEGRTDGPQQGHDHKFRWETPKTCSSSLYERKPVFVFKLIPTV